MNKTFRALIQNEDKHKIRLSTNDGLTGYKIHKVQLMPNNPGTAHQEGVVKIFTLDPGTATPSSTVNFDDPTLVAVAYYQDNSDKGFIADLDVIFDSMVFNQDIFVTYKSTDGTESINYYIELEQVKLSKDEATVATLKDMRGRE
tara:strand:- start:777 stop:1211 length:435 start_codon:yes stop_codon:yes gene_type:complete